MSVCSEESQSQLHRDRFTALLKRVPNTEDMRGKRCDYCGKVTHLSHLGIYGQSQAHFGHWFCSFACCYSDAHGNTAYGRHAPKRNQYSMVHADTLPL